MIKNLEKKLKFLELVDEMKLIKRAVFLKDWSQESDAEHSYHLALMVMIFIEDFPELNYEKAIKLVEDEKNKKISQKTAEILQKIAAQKAAQLEAQKAAQLEAQKAAQLEAQKAAQLEAQKAAQQAANTNTRAS